MPTISASNIFYIILPSSENERLGFRLMQMYGGVGFSDYLGIGALSGGRWRRGKESGSYHCSSAPPSCSVFYPAEVYDEPCAVWCSRKFGLDLCGLQSTHVHVAN